MKSKPDYPSVKLNSETNLSTSLLQDPFQIILLQSLRLHSTRDGCTNRQGLPVRKAKSIASS